MEIRPAKIEDALGAQSVVKAAFARYFRGDAPGPAPYTRDQDHYRGQARAGQLYVLVQPGTGYLGAALECRQEGQGLVVTGLAVHPMWQGQGHGRRLLQHAEGLARLRNLAVVALECRARVYRPSRTLAAMGYVETGRRDGLVVLEKPLNGEEKSA